MPTFLVDFRTGPWEVELPPFEFAPQRGVSARLWSMKDGPAEFRIRIQIRVEDVSDEKAAVAIATSAVERFIDRTAFELRCVVPRAKLLGADLQPEPGPGVVRSGVAYVFVDAYPPTVKTSVAIDVSPARLESLREVLNRDHLPGDAHFGLYRAAVAADDPTTRYMLFYCILLTLNEDKQEKVDEFILSVQPTVERTPQPPRSPTDKKVKMETLYTRLRNQLSHRRDGTSFEKTQKDMQDHLTGLEEVVRQCIQMNG